VSRDASARARIRRGELLRLAVAIVFFTAAPTAGDIGSCGQSPDDLDPVKFFEAKAAVDCERCTACGLETKACVEACNGPVARDFPRACEPLVHDGEVCIDALRASSCADYADYVADQGATAPTECDFCPAEGPP
jgi:hypothetical protein